MGKGTAGEKGKKQRRPSNGPEASIKKKKFYKPVPVKKMPKRYENVRFFEKRKILRKIEQYEKKIATAKLVANAATATEDDKNSLDELKKELEKWEKDLIYVKYFPKKEKYISLYPKSNYEQAAEARDEMRQKAEQIKERIEERKEKSRIANRKHLAAKRGLPYTSNSESESEETHPVNEESENEAEDEEADDFFL